MDAPNVGTITPPKRLLANIAPTWAQPLAS